ncbi:MAG: hypothetical protein COV98_05560 [Candidatus Altarchaeum sp. CG12_big_fil_rev_8_21_14_0_65_33_22]|nr:CBS domain-containing protein [Candidatus Altarchaeum hamiconexum]NCT00535.1 CBS domain-containing protein [Candidatus Altarchaeum hamiconexum]OIQ05238.1 MAG: hypothetical protein AUK59_04665 [Candidatus Altarchaeum sp. CG2_30_32_3053]PIN66941.1 MAG: hypothetical protein COV98_05560 [Candidatus Altarchaeum sp. CG12_big_fil_rev_8_21_14_0_65_33_22]PIV27914.1 MAG: hypothetical protein COS36_04070 [Candidatus Altarchaeum sp. CG03_land_8_20_14_0_80_32_618]
MDETEIIKNIKLVEVKDKWMTRGIKTVDINDDCKTLKEIFNCGDGGVVVQDVSEFGDEEIVGWITRTKFIENFNKNQECKVGDIMDKNFSRIPPSSTVLAAELKLKNVGTFSLPIIAIHFGKEIPMGYLTLDDIKDIKKKYLNGSN